jgi:hypothetical protein
MATEKHNIMEQIEHKSNVKIISNYTYSRSFIGLRGIVVKVAGEGFNVFISKVNGGGSYFDQIFWFPANCLKLI